MANKKPSVTDIYKALRHFFYNYNYRLENSYVFAWESDFFCMSNTGYMYEVEVKTAKSDFKADFKKPKHEVLTRCKEKMFIQPSGFNENRPLKDAAGNYIKDKKGLVQYEKVSSGIHYVIPDQQLPNCFYYACPAGLIPVEKIPAYAGLLHIDPAGYCYLVKKAPYLHKNKLFRRKLHTLFEKFYHLSLNTTKKTRLAEFTIRNLKFENRKLTQLLKKNGVDPSTGHSDYVSDLDKIGRISRELYGNPTNPAPNLHHLKKEIDEILAAPRDIKEWADALILLCGGFIRAGFIARHVVEAALEKSEYNKTRPQGQPDENGVIEHLD